MALAVTDHVPVPPVHIGRAPTTLAGGGVVVPPVVFPPVELPPVILPPVELPVELLPVVLFDAKLKTTFTWLATLVWISAPVTVAGLEPTVMILLVNAPV